MTLVLISDASTPSTSNYLGFVSDRRLLSYFHTFSSANDAFSSFQSFLSRPLQDLPLPSLFIYSSVIAAPASATVLDAMRLMSEEGVSSVAVIEDTGRLLSAVSVTDIGKVSCSALSNMLMTTNS
jgi:CBS-domain-containing membrane protein